MTQDDATLVDLESFKEALKHLSNAHYALPQQQTLENVFNSVTAQFMASRSLNRPAEGRGLALVGGTRSGKSHAVKVLLETFRAKENPLGTGFDRSSIRILVRPGMTWRHLGSAMLRELGYPSDLAHRSADQIWTRVESLLQRKGIFLICFDEFQHFAHEKNAAQLRSILDSLKDLMKRSEWPIMPIVTGVPPLAEILNHSKELTALMEPAEFKDIDYDEASIEEIDGIVVQYADLAGVDVSGVRDEEIYRRMIHASLRRWGRLIEMVIHTFAFAQVQGQMEIDKIGFAKTFQRWTGASDGANPFLVASPYRIDVAKLLPS